MYKIESIVISGFRRLTDLHLKTKPFMVLVGANSVGKTSLLDALALLSSSTSGRLLDSLSSIGGLASILTRGKAHELYFIISLINLNPLPLDYHLRIKRTGAWYSIDLEVLSTTYINKDMTVFIESGDGLPSYYSPRTLNELQPNFGFNTRETALSQAPKNFPEIEEIRRTLAACTLYRTLDVGPRSPVKLPQQLRPTMLPGADGGDLVAYLFNLRESNPIRYEAIIDTLKAAFPGFEALGFPPVAAGMVTMTWKEKSFDKVLYINELSEGTIRFLWLVSLLQSPELPAITMIDEPEVSLHPELLGLLVELMREASKRSQIIVATHSDRFVRFLKPEEVVVMDIGEDGGATATWADEMDLGKWLEDYSLDEVWRMGRMGGRS